MDAKQVEKRMRSHGVNVVATSVRNHINPDGSPVVMIDRVRATEEQLLSMVPAVAAFMSGLKVLAREETVVRGKAKFSSRDVEAQPKDLLAATLVLHQQEGDAKGDELERPYIGVVIGDGLKHRIDFKGRPLSVCKFCNRSNEGLLLTPSKQARYHKGCLNQKLVDLSKQRTLSPAAQLLA